MYKKAYDVEMYEAKVIGPNGESNVYEVPVAIDLCELELQDELSAPTQWKFNEPGDPSTGAYMVNREGRPTGTRIEFY